MPADAQLAISKQAAPTSTILVTHILGSRIRNTLIKRPYSASIDTSYAKPCD